MEVLVAILGIAILIGLFVGIRRLGDTLDERRAQTWVMSRWSTIACETIDHESETLIRAGNGKGSPTESGRTILPTRSRGI